MERCSKCKKKTHIIHVCTCKQLLCLKCRMPEDHGCTYDHRAAYKELLALKNPKVTVTKVEVL